MFPHLYQHSSCDIFQSNKLALLHIPTAFYVSPHHTCPKWVECRKMEFWCNIFVDTLCVFDDGNFPFTSVFTPPPEPSVCGVHIDLYVVFAPIAGRSLTVNTRLIEYYTNSAISETVSAPRNVGQPNVCIRIRLLDWSVVTHFISTTPWNHNIQNAPSIHILCFSYLILYRERKRETYRDRLIS